MKKYIFLDIDGTLRDPFYGIPDSAIKAVSLAKEKGNIVIVCTGRTMGLIPDDFPKAMFDGFIAGGGCYIEINGEKILDVEIDSQKVKSICHELRKHKILHRLETKTSVYMEPEMANMLEFLGDKANRSNSEIKQMIAKRNKFEFKYSIDDFLKTPVPVTKICTVSDSKNFEIIKNIFRNDFSIISHSDQSTGMVNTEIIQKGFDKGTAIDLYCKTIGVDKKNTVAFGDSMNDIDMFRADGLTVAMGNGEKALKDIADIVCGNLLEDGLYEGFVKSDIL